MKIKKGDNIKIIIGRDRGKSGIVERVFPRDNLIVVKGIHLLKKHLKPSQKNPRGGIIEINKKIDVSNVMIICQNCGKNSRVKYQSEEKGKLRICHHCQRSL